MSRYDAEVGVVGAGPAGARAAELLADAGADVLLLDPRVPWEKPCGGGLPASAFDHVPALEEVRPRARRIDAVDFRTSGDDAGFSVSLDRPMYMVSRRDLGRWQLDRAEAAGARHAPVAVRTIERDDPGGWRLANRDGDEHRVRLLVGADGAASLVRRVVAPELRVELAPTRVAYPAGSGPRPGTVLVRLYDDVQGYFWDFARPDHRSVGVGTEPGHWNRARMDREIDDYRTPDGGPDEDAEPRAGAVIGTAALGHGRFEAVGGSDYALLGDAAGFADPATGEGIQNALLSADLVAEAYRRDGTLSGYPRLARETFAREFRHARILRTILFGIGLGPRLVRRGERAAWPRALVAAIMNATNEHDIGLPGLARRSVRTWLSRARRSADGSSHDR